MKFQVPVFSTGSRGSHSKTPGGQYVIPEKKEKMLIRPGIFQGGLHVRSFVEKLENLT